jgi:hypothetical protein
MEGSRSPVDSVADPEEFSTATPGLAAKTTSTHWNGNDAGRVLMRIGR